jgi:hypothetical protein
MSLPDGASRGTVPARGGERRQEPEIGERMERGPSRVSGIGIVPGGFAAAEAASPIRSPAVGGRARGRRAEVDREPSTC